MDKKSKILPSLIIGISIIFSMMLLTNTLKLAFADKKSINVTGSAKFAVKSDLGILTLNITERDADASVAYQKVLKNIPTLLTTLTSYGFSLDSINVKNGDLLTNYKIENGMQTNQILDYSYYAYISVKSSNVELIESAANKISSLIAQGIFIQVSPPEYLYTKLQDTKIKVQADAAKNAQERAEVIAKSSGSSLGNLISARMGVLQIVPQNSNQVSDYGINDASTIYKDIIAVVNATFVIE